MGKMTPITVLWLLGNVNSCDMEYLEFGLKATFKASSDESLTTFDTIYVRLPTVNTILKRTTYCFHTLDHTIVGHVGKEWERSSFQILRAACRVHRTRF